MTDDEYDSICETLWKSNTKPALLSIESKYADNYIPQCNTENSPWRGANLKVQDGQSMNYDELLSRAEKLLQGRSLDVTKKQSEWVEKQTREQLRSKKWQKYRAGRVTASNMRKVFVCSLDKPAKSTVKAVCYPSSMSFQNKATAWGCQHEADALSSYTERQRKVHTNFCISKCGFIISTETPYIGATPDSVVSCDCCGEGCVEVKCPYSVRDSPVSDIASHKNSSLASINGKLQLKRDHDHYFQVQTQMYVTEYAYADYVVWTNQGLFVERVTFDIDLIDRVVTKVKDFFKFNVLPELLGGYFSRPDPYTVNRTIPHTHNSEAVNEVIQNDEVGENSTCEDERTKITAIVENSTFEDEITQSAPIDEACDKVNESDGIRTTRKKKACNKVNKSDRIRTTRKKEANSNRNCTNTQLFCTCQTPYDHHKSYIGCDGNNCPY